MKKYKTLLFDADNTLLDFDKTEKEALRKTFTMQNIPFTPAMKNRYLQINTALWNAYEEGRMTREEVIFTRFGKLFDEFHIAEDGVQFEHIYQKELGKGHALMPHALELVKHLKKDYELYIVTNGVSATQHSRLHDSGLDQHIRKAFISEEIGYRKPMKEYFDYCFAHIPSFEKEQTLIIGDSLSSDMQGGIHAGIATCWMNPKQKPNMQDLPITYEITNLKELYSILEEDEK